MNVELRPIDFIEVLLDGVEGIQFQISPKSWAPAMWCGVEGLNLCVRGIDMQIETVDLEKRLVKFKVLSL